MEVKALRTNIVVITKFIYDHILTWFGCPLIVVINQGTHFINDVIHHLINHLILIHTSSTIYYPYKNKQSN